MKTHFTKGEWRFSREFLCVTTSKFGIIEGGRTICDISPNLNSENQEVEAVANGLVIAQSLNLLNLALKNYVIHQRLANKSIEYAIESDAMRAMLASTIATSLGVDTQLIQEWVEQLAKVEDIKIEEIKFE